MTSLIHRIPNAIIADTVQEQLFALIGSNRSPFRGISNWPWLDDLLHERSVDIRDRYGEAAWQEAGGKLNSLGKPTLDLRSDTVEMMLQEVEQGHGGLLWQNSDGVAWAMILDTISHNSTRSRCGYGISWWRHYPNGLDPLARERCYDQAQEKWESKEALERLADELQLFRRAEQLLWLTHSQVLAQGSSLVMIPDVSVAEVIWGDRSRWPQNWRRDVQRAFTSLTGLHSEAVRFVGKGWQPRWQAHSVALSHVSFVPRNSTDQFERCPRGCLLHPAEASHNHYRVQVGYGFLGVLEKYMTKCVDDLRFYDFSCDPVGRDYDELKESRREGRIITTNLPLKLMGSASWSGLARREQNLLAGLVREITRAKKEKQVWVIRHGRVVGARQKETTICPFLKPAETYVVFGGNGHRRGCGYKIVGGSRTGWLAKCGNDCEGLASNGLRAICRTWLGGLKELQQVLGLIPAGVHPETGEWFHLEAMQGLVRHKAGWRLLNQLHVRLYAPANYESRLRQFFAERAGFAAHVATPLENPGLGFGLRMARLGIKQQDLADHLRTSRPYVNRLLNGKRWPPSRVQQVELWLAQKESQV